MTVRCPWSGATAQMVVKDATQHIQGKWARGVFYEQEGLLRDAWNRFKDAPPPVVIDVGACLGNHTIWFAKALDAKVVALEPHAPYRAHLEENLAANQVEAIVLPYAAGSREAFGKAKSLGGEGMMHVVPGFEFKVNPLDKLALPDPDIIKVDVEGYELPVLWGAERLIKKARPVLYVEGHAQLLEPWAEANDYSLVATFNATPTHRLEPNA